MAGKPSFSLTAWNRLRPKLLAVVVDAGEYVVVWLGIVIAHLVKLAVAAAGVESDIIQPISVMEKWTWIASFAMFFWRSLLRMWRSG
jgi:hypothetical protein